MIEIRRRASAVLAACLCAAACSPGGGATGEAMRRGDQLFAQKRYAAAAQAYRAAVDANPADSAAKQKLGEALAKAGDSVRAADLLPDDVDVQVRAAGIMLQRGRFTDVLSRTDVILRQHPDNSMAMVLRACATARLSDTTLALYQLTDTLGDVDRFERVRHDLRPKVASSDDEEAEAILRASIAAAPDFAEARMAYANLLWALGRLDEAEQPLRSAADQLPSHATANHALGAFYLARNRGSEALPYLKKAADAPGASGRGARLLLADYLVSAARDSEARAVLESAKGDDEKGDVTIRLATLDMRAGQPAEAARKLDVLLARIPTHPQAHLLKARLLFEHGNIDARFARAAVEADTGSSQAHMLLGQVLEARHDLTGAIEQYREASRTAPTAVEPQIAVSRTSLAVGAAREAVLAAKEAVRLSPDDKPAVLALVTASIAAKDLDAAASALAPLLTRLPSDPDVAATEGHLLAARGSDAGARAAFLRALAADDGAIEALAGLVAIDARGTPSPETVARVDRALERSPGNVALLLMAADLHAALKEAPRTEALLRQALIVDPGNVTAVLELSNLMVSSGRPDEALAMMRRIVEQRLPRYLEVWADMARLLERVGRTDEARQQFEQIVVAHPDDADISFRLAQSYLGSPEKLNAALELAMAAKRGRPDDPDVSLLLGRIYTEKGLSGLAIGALNEALRARPDNAIYHFHLAAALERSGNLSQARTEYARALQIDSSFPGADKAREMAGNRR